MAVAGPPSLSISFPELPFHFSLFSLSFSQFSIFRFLFIFFIFYIFFFLAMAKPSRWGLGFSQEWLRDFEYMAVWMALVDGVFRLLSLALVSNRLRWCLGVGLFVLLVEDRLRILSLL